MIIEMTKSNLVYVGFRRKRIILTTMLTLIALTVLYTLVAKPQYAAKASLVVNFTQLPGLAATAAPGQNQPTPTPLDHEEIINTNIYELKSEQLAREVIQDVGVDKLYPKHFSLNPMAYVGMAMEALSNKPASEEIAQQRALENAVARFVKIDLEVKGEPRSNVIYVTVTNQSRGLAVEVAQKLIDRFLEHEAQTARNPRLEFIRGQLEIYKKQAADAQAALQELKSTKHIYSLGEETTALIQERALVEQSYLTVHNRAIEAKQRFDALLFSRGKMSPVITTPQNDRDPLELNARTNLADLKTREAKLLNTYDESSENVIDIRAQIKQAEGILAKTGGHAPLTHSDPNAAYQQLQVAVAQAKADLDAARESEISQKAQLAGIDKRFLARSADEAAYQNAVRDNDLAAENYKAYLQGVQEARVSEDLNKEKITSISIFDAVYAPTKPVSPRVMLILLFGIIGGALLGALFALLSEALDETFNTPAQVTAVLGIPVIGSMRRI